MIFMDFSKFRTVILPNAAPPRRGTTHIGGAPDAHHTKVGQTDLRCPVPHLQSFLRKNGWVFGGLVLTFVNQKARS